MAPALVERWLTDGYRAAEPGLSQVLVDMLRRTPDAGYSRNCAALRDADYRDRVAAIRARTLVISSTHDLAATPAQGRELAAAIPARATSSWTRHTSPTGNGPRNSTAPCSASCWPSESRRTPHATLETPARGLELGRLRPRRPTRPPQPHHRRTGAQGRPRDPRRQDLLPVAAAGPARRQRAQPAPPSAAAEPDAAARHALPELPAAQRQSRRAGRAERRPGAAVHAVLDTMGRAGPRRRAVRRRRRRPARAALLQRLCRRRT